MLQKKLKEYYRIVTYNIKKAYILILLTLSLTPVFISCSPQAPQTNIDTNYIELIPFNEAYSGTLINYTIGYYYENIGMDYYIGHALIYQKLNYADYVSGDFMGGELVRCGGAKLYKLIDSVMVYQNYNVLNTVESEFVLQLNGFVGGYHGNEFMSKVYFVVDNKIINNDGSVSTFGAISLKPCRSFRFQQKSQLYHGSSHTVIANRSKVNVFKEGGYEVETKIIWIVKANLWAYTSLFSISKDTHNQVISDMSEIYSPIGNNEFLIKNDCYVRKLFYLGGEKGIAIQVTNDINGDLDKTAFVKLWDRSSDTKYYRQTVNFNTEIGEVFETKSKITISGENCISPK
jgi:hypothetical protein